MTDTKKLFTIGLCLLLPLCGQAADDDPDEAAAHTRHALMEVMAWTVGPAGDMATGKAPYDQARAATHAKRLVVLGEMIGEAFARDTSGKELDRDTEARDEIWQNPDDFAEKAAAMVAAAEAYTAATADSEAAARKAFVKLGGTCKGCHEEYKD